MSALAYLRSVEAEFHAAPPSLVVVPLSTLGNWAAEAALWTPTSNVVVLHGNKASRAVIAQHELLMPDGVTPKASVVITTYETVMADTPLFVPPHAWAALVLDEGHKIKAGPAARGFSTLRSLDVGHALFLTGTPVQNNVKELFHLLHFLRPDLYPTFEAFTTAARGAGGRAQDDAARLHELAKRHMLRRTKREVLTDLPSRREVRVPVDLSPLQAAWYRALLTRSYGLLSGSDAASAGSAGGSAGGGGAALHNLVIQLRKVANHPYLIDGTEPLSADDADAPGAPRADAAAAAASSAARLAALRVAASGKLQLLASLLPALRARGHRVLLFSQFVRQLDVLEDYVSSAFGRSAFERVDGGVCGPDRQAAIARFSAPGSAAFVFLLSTRACGLGLNLTSADTVIIYDSDWCARSGGRRAAGHRLWFFVAFACKRKRVFLTRRRFVFTGTRTRTRRRWREPTAVRCDTPAENQSFISYYSISLLLLFPADARPRSRADEAGRGAAPLLPRHRGGARAARRVPQAGARRRAHEGRRRAGAGGWQRGCARRGAVERRPALGRRGALLARRRRRRRRRRGRPGG